MRVENAATNLAAQTAARVQAPSAAPPERASLSTEKAPAAAQAAERAQAQAGERREQSAVVDIEGITANQPSGARFRVDETTKRLVGQVLDANREVIKQIPPEEVLRISANFRRLTAILFDEQA